MPYKDPAQARAAKRRSAAKRRANQTGNQRMVPPVGSVAAMDQRLSTADALLHVLGEQVELVRFDPDLGSAQRARTLARLGDVLLRAAEQAEVVTRIYELEAVLGSVKEDGQIPARGMGGR